MNNQVKNIQKWAHDNVITLNKIKTKSMLLISKGEPDKIKIMLHTHNCLHDDFDNCQCTEYIEQVECFKYLGLTIDFNFSWSTHIQKLTKLLRVISYYFKYLKYKTTVKNLKLIYFSLVESHLNYGIQCYGSTSETNLKILTSIQNKIIDLMLPDKKKHCLSKAEKYNELNILPLKEFYLYRIILKYYYNENLLQPKKR